ncbi:MAG: alpha-galactosidase [Planctomycetes bacterium]|nr:alpha-galactosidase [Planctomycetota bacterium]MBL7038012.1 alpha-galactosidase [Pirellulaceae bacterium]
MQKTTIWISLLFGLGFLTTSASAVELTAVTLFGCDDRGTVDAAFRNNSGPLDAAWDIFLYEGDVFDPARDDLEKVRWLNKRDDHTLQIPLGPGTYTITFHCEFSRQWPAVGMNLFFDGHHDKAGISVKAPMDASGPPSPDFVQNNAAKTMGWPISEIPAAGSLSYGGPDSGIWDFLETSQGLKVTLKSFRCSVPTVDGKLDLVGPHQIGPSGKPDTVGQLVLKVEPINSKPPDLLVWLQTIAGVTAGGPDMANHWKEQIDWEKTPEPFSFTYGGEPSTKVLKRCRRTSEHKRLDADRTAHDVLYVDPDTGLQVRWEGVEYPRFKTVEWTLTFKNTGTADTPIIADIQALDSRFQRRKSSSEFVLQYNRGDTCAANGFEPLTKLLEPNDVFRSAPNGGRPTNGEFPYFNLRAGSEGVIVVVGWPGQWAARFARDGDRAIHVTAGQELTHLKLHPSEEVRTPLVVLQFTDQGDWIDSQNVWRQWMIQHNLPRPAGKPLPLPMLNACSSHQFAEMTKANEQNQIEFIDSYLQKGLKLDYWWMDAGWYVGAAEKGWPWTGTWEVDRRPHRFPNGLRAISDHARAKGVKTIVWFEPERVAAGTWLATEHPEWVLGGNGGGLLNLGNPEAWNWLVDHIDKIITKEGIDLYRQDYNIDPLGSWRGNDTEDRQGVTENKYVTGYLAYWDELLRRHPGMLIDSCASGGRRNDLETMRRAVPLLRSDYLFEPVGQQGHTYGLSFWLPFHGTGYCPSNTAGWGWGTGDTSYDPYTRRSNMCPSNTACFDFRVEVDDSLIQKLYSEWLEVGPDYFGDYYPLTAHSLEEDSWIAWQFHRPGVGKGMVQAFRRSGSDFYGGQFKLRGLRPDAQYEVRNFDEPGKVTLSGQQLMETGTEIAIKQQPGAAVVVYKRVDSPTP